MVNLSAKTLIHWYLVFAFFAHFLHLTVEVSVARDMRHCAPKAENAKAPAPDNFVALLKLFSEKRISRFSWEDPKILRRFLYSPRRSHPLERFCLVSNSRYSITVNEILKMFKKLHFFSHFDCPFLLWTISLYHKIDLKLPPPPSLSLSHSSNYYQLLLRRIVLFIHCSVSKNGNNLLKKHSKKYQINFYR